MKKISSEQLADILAKHKKFLAGEPGGERADLSWTYLCGEYLRGASLQGANLNEANLKEANLHEASLQRANLQGTSLQGANLRGTDLERATGMVKNVGVEPGNCYWKRFEIGLINNGYQFRVGLNELRPGEVFADDEREICSYPGFHFASRSWCALNYKHRPLEAKIRIPMDAKINEPWATNGKASSDKIEILQVFNTLTGEDVTDKYI